MAGAMVIETKKAIALDEVIAMLSGMQGEPSELVAMMKHDYSVRTDALAASIFGLRELAAVVAEQNRELAELRREVDQLKAAKSSTKSAKTSASK